MQNLIVTEADLSILDGEARISDQRLGELLGFARPRAIRQLIKRYLPELQQFGPSATTMALVPGGMFGLQQEVMVTYLNRRQALYIAAKAGTPKASDITVMMVDVFDRVMFEKQTPTQPQLPPPSTPSMPPALIRSLAQERLRARPEWRKIRGYARRGFQCGEIAKVMGISSGKVASALSQMRHLGLVGTPTHV